MFDFNNLEIFDIKPNSSEDSFEHLGSMEINFIIYVILLFILANEILKKLKVEIDELKTLN